MPFFLVLAAVFFMLVRFEAGDSVTSYYVLMFFCGFFLGGPFNIISSAIAADLVFIEIFYVKLIINIGKKSCHQRQ